MTNMLKFNHQKVLIKFLKIKHLFGYLKIILIFNDLTAR